MFSFNEVRMYVTYSTTQQKEILLDTSQVNKLYVHHHIY